jgi:hypothetical protein
MGIKKFEIGELVFEFNADQVYNSWKHSMEGILDEDEEYDEWDGIGCNRQFAPLERIGIDQLRELCIIESQHLHDIEEGNKTILHLHESEDEAISEGRNEPYMILDIGVRSTVMALLELGAYPFSSCNGGCFLEDNRHTESYPVIAMYGENDILHKIEQTARLSGCGLYEAQDLTGMGGLVLYTNNIRNFSRMTFLLLALLEK